jgi:hypothetical protein
MTALAALALLALIFGTAYTVELAMRRREEKAVMRFIQQEMNERASRLEQAKQAFLDAQLASVELEESDTTAEEAERAACSCSLSASERALLNPANQAILAAHFAAVTAAKNEEEAAERSYREWADRWESVLNHDLLRRMQAL